MPLTVGNFSWNNLEFLSVALYDVNTWFSWNRKLKLMALDGFFQVMVAGVCGVIGQRAPSHAVGVFKLGRESATILFQSGRGGSVKGWALKSSAVTQTTVPVGRWRLYVWYVLRFSCSIFKCLCFQWLHAHLSQEQCSVAADHPVLAPVRTWLWVLYRFKLHHSKLWMLWFRKLSFSSVNGSVSQDVTAQRERSCPLMGQSVWTEKNVPAWTSVQDTCLNQERPPKPPMDAIIGQDSAHTDKIIYTANKKCLTWCVWIWFNTSLYQLFFYDVNSTRIFLNVQQKSVETVGILSLPQHLWERKAELLQRPLPWWITTSLFVIGQR